MTKKPVESTEGDGSTERDGSTEPNAGMDASTAEKLRRKKLAAERASAHLSTLPGWTKVPAEERGDLFWTSSRASSPDGRARPILRASARYVT